MTRCLLLACTIVGMTSGCFAEAQEIKRVSAPDARVDAVLVVSPGNATAVDATEIFIVPFGQPVGGTPIFEGDRFNGIDMGWNGPKELTIVYASGRVSQFTNTWQSSKLDDFRYTVTVHLKESNYPVFKAD